MHPTPPHHDPLQALLASTTRPSRQAQPRVSAASARMRPELLGVLAVAAAVVLVLALGDLARTPASQRSATRQPATATTAPANDAAAAATPADARSLMDQSLTLLEAGSFDAASALLDGVNGDDEIAQEASRIRDRIRRAKDSYDNNLLLASDASEVGDWRRVIDALDAARKLAPLPADREALLRNARDQIEIATALEAARTTLEDGDRAGALEQARAGWDRWKHRGFRELMVEALRAEARTHPAGTRPDSSTLTGSSTTRSPTAATSPARRQATTSAPLASRPTLNRPTAARTPTVATADLSSLQLGDLASLRGLSPQLLAQLQAILGPEAATLLGQQ